MQKSKLSIGIAGAGIGGLAAATLLAQDGHSITVYDQFSAPKPVGSGLVIQPVGLDVLDRLGAGVRARKLGNPITRMLGEDVASQRRVLDVSYGASFGLAIHRASLFHVLFDAAQDAGVEITPDSCVKGRWKQSFLVSDKKTRAFDLLVDAAGARSQLSPLKARPLGYGAIWGTVDWRDLGFPISELRQKYRRANRMLGVLPIGELPNNPVQKAAIFWSLPVSDYELWKTRGLDAWRKEALLLWPEFATFLEQITSPQQMTMARYSHGTLTRPYSEGLVHIGDAAHRASPQLGQGANMALLDALALRQALRHCDPFSAPRAYAQCRKWHVRTYQVMSALFTPQYQSDSRWLPYLRDWLLFPASQLPPSQKILTSLVCGNMLPPLASLTPTV